MQLSTAIPKLGAVGYAEWSPAMRAALVVQRAWAVVRDGVDEAEDEELLARDETALALLMLNVEPLYRPTIDARTHGTRYTACTLTKARQGSSSFACSWPPWWRLPCDELRQVPRLH